MRLRAISTSFLVLLYVSLQLTPITVDGVVSIAVTTRNWVYAGTTGTLQITLWFDSVIYTFEIAPTTSATSYTDTSTGWGTTTCDETRVMIESSVTDGVAIDYISFTTESGVYYGIDGICIPSSVSYVTKWGSELGTLDDSACSSGSSHLTSICVDNESDDCGPSKQILYFDTTQPNQYITGATWRDGSTVTLSSKSCDGTETSTATTTSTPMGERSSFLEKVCAITPSKYCKVPRADGTLIQCELVLTDEDLPSTAGSSYESENDAQNNFTATLTAEVEFDLCPISGEGFVYEGVGIRLDIGIESCGYRWSGTAPFCNGGCDSGEDYVRKDAYGDGAYCVTGWKHLCKECLTVVDYNLDIVEDVENSAPIWRCSQQFPKICGAGFGDFGINVIVLMTHDEANKEIDFTVSMDLCADFGDTIIASVLGGDAEVCTEEIGFGANADLKFDIFKGSFPVDVTQFDCSTRNEDGDYCDIARQIVPQYFHILIIIFFFMLKY
eukprot:810494_1